MDDKPQSVTSEELRRHMRRIIEELHRGTIFVWTHYGEPLAMIVPVTAQDDKPTD